MRALLLVATVIFASPAFATTPDQCSLGRVCVTMGAGSSFNGYTQSPSLAQQQWMQDHYWRLRVYAPYFDSRLSWFPDAWFYQDLYAIYPNDNPHPEWILRDGGGNWLYIPYALSLIHI